MRSRTASLGLALLLVAACNSRGGGGSFDLGTGADGGGADGGGVDLGHPADAGAHDAAATDAGATPDVFRVEFATTKGSFTVEATRAWAPNGVDRFYQLVQAGFYDDTRFFRVIAGFVAQFGMNGDPAVNATWSHRTIPDDPVMTPNAAGTLTFAATSAPNSRTTQLFVNLADNSASLDAQGFAPIARIVSGDTVPAMLYSGYADMPDQTMIGTSGNAYLDSTFPMLDHIVTARVVP